MLRNKPFLLLCASYMLFFMSFNMILPDIYNFLESLGGAEYKGYVISLFTLTAALSRPFSGRISDRLGRKPVIFLGGLFSALGSLAYIFIGPLSLLFSASALWTFLFLRLAHGLSTGFSPTGAVAMASDIIPENNRAQALGWVGFAGSLGMGVGPSVGSYIHLHAGYDVLFASSATVALLSCLLVLGMRETLEKSQRQKPNLGLLKVSFKDFIEPRVAKPTLILFLYSFGFGCIFTLMPDRQEAMGIENKGFFFTLYILVAALGRAISGGISDKKGRIPVLKVSLTMMSLAYVVMIFGESKSSLAVAAILYGLAHGHCSPALFAWTTDLSLETRRARAFSTLFIGMELGIGIGAFCAGKIYQNKIENFDTIIYVCLLMTVLSIGLLFYKKNHTTLVR